MYYLYMMLLYMYICTYLHIGKNGCFSLLKLLPPTREIVEMFCVYAETQLIDW